VHQIIAIIFGVSRHWRAWGRQPVRTFICIALTSVLLYATADTTKIHKLVHDSNNVMNAVSVNMNIDTICVFVCFLLVLCCTAVYSCVISD